LKTVSFKDPSIKIKEMGQPLTITNQTNSGIWVEWWTAGYGFKVYGYGINANSSRSESLEAVWYSIKIIADGKEFRGEFYGGSSAHWLFDGTRILIIAGSKSGPEGTLSIPLNDPTVQSVIGFLRAIKAE
jgi:hypothetical protein